MKKTARICIVALLALTVFRVGPGMAEEGLYGSVTVSPEYYLGDEDNAKFNEYRYNKDTEVGGWLDIDLLYAPLDTDHRMKLKLRYESPEDVDVDLGSMVYGMYRFDATYQRMGHVFARDVNSLYSGNETNHLTINDAIQSGAETAPNAAALADFLQAAAQSSHKIDLQLRRDKVGAELRWDSLDPVTFQTYFNYESRVGSRPYGGNFSFSNAVEVPEPIDYDTYNAGIDAVYAGKWLYASMGYTHSTFDNSYQSFTYDNPLLLAGQPNIGRNSLPPSNSFNEVHATVAKNLPLNSRVTTNFSYAFMRQDEQLMPASINPTIVLTPLPRDTAEASVDRYLIQAVLSSRPIDKLLVKLTGKYYQHNNDTPEALFQNVRSDVSDEGDEPTEYVSWVTREVGGEISYEVYHRTNVGFEYEYESESYTNGSADKERVNTFKLTGDSFATDWMNSRVELVYQSRESRYPDYTEAELPWMRKFYAADLDHYGATAMAGFTPLDELSICLEYIFGLDNYGESLFGLQDGIYHTASIDVDYQLTDMVSFFVFYSYDYVDTKQKDRRWLPGGIGDPYGSEPQPGSNSNWQVELEENVHTVGLGSEIAIIPELLTLKLDGNFSIVDGDATFFSPIGTAGVDDNNAFAPNPFENVDETTWWKAGAELKYSLTKKLGLSAGYRFEDWNIDDYTYDGLTLVKRNTAGDFDGLIDMNTLYRPYTVHTVYLTASYTFD